MLTRFANNLFEQPWWLDIVAEGKWTEVISVDENGDIDGRIPIVCGRNSIHMPPLTPTLGIWIEEKYRNDYSKQKRIINNLISKFPNKKNIELRLSTDNYYVLPFRWKGYIIEPKFTYRINDLSNIENIYSRFNKSTKRKIKNASKLVNISSKVDIDKIKIMLDKTFEAQNRMNPMKMEVVKKIIETCEKRGSGKYIAAIDDSGNIHSCAYFVYDEKVCYYLIGASDSAFRDSGAQSLVMWEGIKFASTHSKVFDFEGSMVEGIENFFRQFASENTLYYEVRKCSLTKEIWLLIKPKIKRLLKYKI